MNDQDYLEARLLADKLRREAEDDDRRAAEVSEDNPMYSDYLRLRATGKRRMANDADGGIGQ